MMEELSFTVEFHDDLEGGVPEPILQQALAGLSKVARGRDDISHALVNFKQPVRGRETQYLYEITIRLWMDGEDVVVTESGQIVEGTLSAALDVLDRQVQKQRERKRGD